MLLERNQKWIRYRFETKELKDPRPLFFDPRYPWWISGTTDNSTIIVMWLPQTEKLVRYYDDAFNIDSSIHDNIEFTSRFSKPNYYKC